MTKYIYLLRTFEMEMGQYIACFLCAVYIGVAQIWINTWVTLTARAIKYEVKISIQIRTFNVGRNDSVKDKIRDFFWTSGHN